MLPRMRSGLSGAYVAAEKRRLVAEQASRVSAKSVRLGQLP